MTFTYIGPETLRPSQAEAERLEAEFASAERAFRRMETNRLPDEVLELLMQPVSEPALPIVNVNITLLIAPAEDTPPHDQDRHNHTR